MIGVDAILGDAELQEGLLLGGQILAVGGAAGVSDEGCGESLRSWDECTDRVPLAQLLPYHSYETLCWCRCGGVRGDGLGRPMDGPLTDSAGLLDPPRSQHYRMAELNPLTAIVIVGMPHIPAKRSDRGNTPA